MKKKVLNIGGAIGFWGESQIGTPQLLKQGSLDYIVYDYLAEITLSIMSRAKINDPEKGYATDLFPISFFKYLMSQIILFVNHILLVLNIWDIKTQ